MAMKRLYSHAPSFSLSSSRYGTPSCSLTNTKQWVIAKSVPAVPIRCGYKGTVVPDSRCLAECRTRSASPPSACTPLILSSSTIEFQRGSLSPSFTPALRGSIRCFSQSAKHYEGTKRDEEFCSRISPIDPAMKEADQDVSRDDLPRAALAAKQPPSRHPLLQTPHENIYTLPNLLTFSRLAAAPVLGYLVLHDAHAWTLALFLYAGATDLVDGWLARRLNQQTVVGSVVDPMADKALMMSTTIALALKGAMPPYLAVIILGRDALLGVSAIYYRWISLPPPKTFARYWDFSLPSAEVRPTTISKYNTLFQLALIGATVTLPMVQEIGWGGVTMLGLGLDDMLRGMQWGVATTTVWSGLSYVYSKDAVRILTPEEGKEMERKQKSEKEAAEKDRAQQ